MSGIVLVMMSMPTGFSVEQALEGGGFFPAQPVKISAHPSFPVAVDPVYVAPARPYPVIVNPFKPRVALREYVRRLSGENKENDIGKEQMDSPSGLPKTKTLGLRRRHSGPPSSVVLGAQSEGVARDKRKFNAPRQTPVKRQREETNEDVNGDACQSLPFASVKPMEVEQSLGSSPSNRQPAESLTPSFKRHSQESFSPINRRPLAPLNFSTNRQVTELHTPITKPQSTERFMPPIHQIPSKPQFSGGPECGGSALNDNLFQLASGKRFQASAASKARAAALFESEVEPAGDSLFKLASGKQFQASAAAKARAAAMFESDVEPAGENLFNSASAKLFQASPAAKARAAALFESDADAMDHMSFDD